MATPSSSTSDVAPTPSALRASEAWPSLFEPGADAVGAQRHAVVGPVGPVGPVGAGATAASDGSLSRTASGWLNLGGERTFSVPGACL